MKPLISIVQTNLQTADNDALKALGMLQSQASLFSETSGPHQLLPLSQLYARRLLRESSLNKPLTIAEWVEHFRNVVKDFGGIQSRMSGWTFDAEHYVTVTENLSIDRIVKKNYLPRGLKEVWGSISVKGTVLTSLKNFPTSRKSLILQDMLKLTSLRGMQKEVPRHLTIINCPALVDLKDVSEKVGRSMILGKCHNLQSLKFLPKYIGENLHLDQCADFDFFPDVSVGRKVFLNKNQVQLKKILEERGIDFCIK